MKDETIESILKENRSFAPTKNFVEEAKLKESDFKNAYDTTADTGTVVGVAGTAETDAGLGFTYIADDGSNVTIATCYVKPCNDSDNVMSNTVSIE